MRIFCPSSVATGVEAHAVGLLHAIAAAFADFFVDHEAHGGLGIFSARALAAFFGRALLVVDHGRDAWDFLRARPGCVPARSGRAIRRWRRGRTSVYFSTILGQHDCLAHAFGFELSRQLRNGQRAHGFLPAGHRDVAVVENLISMLRPLAISACTAS